MGIPASPTGRDALDVRLKHHPGHQESSEGGGPLSSGLRAILLHRYRREGKSGQLTMLPEQPLGLLRN